MVGTVIGQMEPAVTDLDMALRIGVALLLGALVGFEREINHQPAGLRTHITVAVGAALFGIISVHGFDAYVQPLNDSNYRVDVTRVASQVVVAIGFLGGGTILKHGGSVRGLTTAASLWVTCAIGLAAGIGSFLAATITTAAVLLSLVALRKPRDYIRARLARERATAVISLRKGADTTGIVHQLLELEGVTVRGLSVRQDGEASHIEAELVGEMGADLSEKLMGIGARDDVTDVDVT